MNRCTCFITRRVPAERTIANRTEGTASLGSKSPKLNRVGIGTEIFGLTAVEIGFLIRTMPRQRTRRFGMDLGTAGSQYIGIRAVPEQ